MSDVQTVLRMIYLNTPRGLPVKVPEHLAEDPSSRFEPPQKEAIREYYDANGYVIVKGLTQPAHCRYLRMLWETEVKPYRGFMYRQATARAEIHSFNENGWVMNPILNLQSVDPRRFPKFRDYSTRVVLTATGLRDLFALLLGEAPKIVQSMYFEGNSATWEHQDTYYLDSEVVGEMAAAWVAIEDISARAGRFFVCPGSHRLKLSDHALYNNIAENHERYITSVVREVTQLGLEIRAPMLQAGDVLFWNSWTVHGSLDSQDPSNSRSSVTCHAIPKSRRFLQLQTRVLDIPSEDIDGTAVHRPKDLALPTNRAILSIESTFPALFYWLKRRAIIHFLERKSRLGPARTVS